MSIRNGGPADRVFLEAMLREAVYPDDPSVSIAQVMQRPDLAMTIPDFSRAGDLALIEEDDGAALGAAWCRCFTHEAHSWGYIDSDTPEVGIAVVPDRRGQGIGTRLLHALMDRARLDGRTALSLCTDPEDRPLSMYVRAGFTPLVPLADDPDVFVMKAVL